MESEMIEMNETIDQNTLKLMCRQLNIEYSAFYLYISCYAYCNKRHVTLPNIAKFFKKQYMEELEHAQGIVDYLNMRGWNVDFQPIQPVNYNFSNIVEMFKKALEYENKATQSILEVYKAAEAKGDYQTTQFLDAYVEEQTLSMKNFSDYLTDAKRCVESHVGLFLFDKEFEKKKK